MPPKRPASTEPPTEATSVPATTRRTSKPRPKTAAVQDLSVDPGPATQPPPSAPPRQTPPAQPVSPAAFAPDDSPSITSEWPEPETSGTSQDGAKRKRRRRKGKGQGPAAAGAPQPPDAPQPPVAPDDSPSAQDPATEDAPESQPSSGRPEPHASSRPPRGSQPQSQAQQPRQVPPRSKLDPAVVARRAWKIYLAEVSEEGVALINDHDARELSRRCFRLAEIFLEEQARRIGGA